MLGLTLPERCGKPGATRLLQKHLAGVRISEHSDLLLQPIFVPELNFKHVLPSSLIHCSSKLSMSLSNVPNKGWISAQACIFLNCPLRGKTCQMGMQGEVSAQSNPHPMQKSWEVREGWGRPTKRRSQRAEPFWALSPRSLDMGQLAPLGACPPRVPTSTEN